MKSPQLTFAIFGNTYQLEKSASISRIISHLRNIHAHIAVEESFYEFIKEHIDCPFVPDEIITSHNVSANFAISLGGDGTFLKCAEFIGNREIPIIGINTGRLGFLADNTPEETAELLEGLIEGKYSIEKRSVLQLISPQDGISLTPCGLNEIAVLKHDNSSMIGIEVYIDNHYLNTYQSDGLIVSTPTCSTGYSLSNGGPIVAPLSGTVVLTAVAPHSMNVRPFVINDECTIRMKVTSRNHNFLLTIDGRSQSVSDQEWLIIRKAPFRIHIVRKYGKDYFETLRNKLMWGADKR